MNMIKRLKGGTKKDVSSLNQTVESKKSAGGINDTERIPSAYFTNELAKRNT